MSSVVVLKTLSPYLIIIISEIIRLNPRWASQSLPHAILNVGLALFKMFVGQAPTPSVPTDAVETSNDQTGSRPE